MKPVTLGVAIVLPLAILSSPVAAQDWEFSAAIYGWGPDTGVTVDTPVGPVSGELTFSEAWEALDLVFMGTFTAQRGKLGLILDTMYLDLSDNRATPGALGFTSADLGSQVSITNAYVTWELMSSATSSLDVGAGVRFYNTTSEVTLQGGPGPVGASASDDWVDPLIAARYRTDLGGNWYGTAFADVGGFGTGSELTWQGVLTAGYRFSDSFSVEAGYRFLRSDRIEANGSIDIDMSGPIIGARWRF